MKTPGTVRRSGTTMAPPSTPSFARSTGHGGNHQQPGKACQRSVIDTTPIIETIAPKAHHRKASGRLCAGEGVALVQVVLVTSPDRPQGVGRGVDAFIALDSRAPSTKLIRSAGVSVRCTYGVMRQPTPTVAPLGCWGRRILSF